LDHVEDSADEESSSASLNHPGGAVIPQRSAETAFCTNQQIKMAKYISGFRSFGIPDSGFSG
jgi:hypothetical protein